MVIVFILILLVGCQPSVDDIISDLKREFRRAHQKNNSRNYDSLSYILNEITKQLRELKNREDEMSSKQKKDINYLLQMNSVFGFKEYRF